MMALPTLNPGPAANAIRADWSTSRQAYFRLWLGGASEVAVPPSRAKTRLSRRAALTRRWLRWPEPRRVGSAAIINALTLGERPQVAVGGAMATRPLRNTFFACLVLGPMIAGTKAAECDGAITTDEALKAEDARYAAQTKSDFDALERLYGDDLVYVHSSAVTDSKSSYIDRQRSGLHYRVMRPSDVKIRVFGCLAIITGRGDYEVTQNGQDSTPHLLFTSIWAKRGPNVQFVSWESTPIPKP